MLSLGFRAWFASQSLYIYIYICPTHTDPELRTPNWDTQPTTLNPLAYKIKFHVKTGLNVLERPWGGGHSGAHIPVEIRGT